MIISGSKPRRDIPWEEGSRPHRLTSRPPFQAERHTENPRIDPHLPTETDRLDATAAPAICFGSFRLLPAQRLLLEGNKPIRLGSRALDILIALVERPGELVGKDELMARVWPNTLVEPANLTVHIAALRRGLGDGRGGNRFLINIPGRGYRFVAPITMSEELEPSPSQPAAARHAHNLPATVTRLIGRDPVVAGLSTQLCRLRFLTIVGPGGVGKTSVAIAVAERVIGTFEHGVWLIDLAPLSDPSFVPSALAETLGVELYSEELLDELIDELREKRMLLVLDNCGHVVTAAAALAAAILRGTPDVQILATSREPLRTEGEHLYRLPPLACPPASPQITATEALGFPAVQLFVAHAVSALGEFDLTDHDAPYVADICRRLDGLPLAIEIAAARVAAFGVRGIAAYLDDGFQLLTGNRRTASPRQQSLSATLDWSYALLGEAERTIFRRLAIFADGFTLRAAGAVAADETYCESETIDLVAELVAKSLVVADARGAEPHFHLLETTRSYALAKLVERGEADAVGRRYEEYLQDTELEDAPGGSPSAIPLPKTQSIDPPDGGWPD